MTTYACRLMLSCVMPGSTVLLGELRLVVTGDVRGRWIEVDIPEYRRRAWLPGAWMVEVVPTVAA